MSGYWEHFYTYFCWTFFWHKLILILNPFLSYLNILLPCRLCSAGQVFYLVCFFLSNKHMIWQHKLVTVWLQRVDILHICKIYTFTTWMNFLQCDMLQFSLSTVWIVLYVMDEVQFIIFHWRFSQSDGSFPDFVTYFFRAASYLHTQYLMFTLATCTSSWDLWCYLKFC